jgi:predicted transcriptional regulator
VREVASQLHRERPLAFNTVQTVMENLFHKGWLNRSRDGRAYCYVTVRSREEYVAGLLHSPVRQPPAASAGPYSSPQILSTVAGPHDGDS